MNASLPALLLLLCIGVLSCSPTTIAEGCVDDSDCQSAERCDEGACRALLVTDSGVLIDREIEDVVEAVDAGVLDAAAPDVPLQCNDNDLDGYGENCDLGNDCDDNNNTLHTQRLLFVDDDEDGYSVGEGNLSCTGDLAPSGFVFEPSVTEDCDDDDDERFVEIEAFNDADDDGVTSSIGELLCTGNTLPQGYQDVASEPADCNDDDNTLSPNLPELCDGIDNNCDGQADSGEVCPCPVVFVEAGVGVVAEDAPRGAEDRLHPYLSCSLNRRFIEARGACTTLENYDLVVIEELAEFDALRKYTGLLRWWTGMNDISAGGQHRFLVPGGDFDGIVPDYLPWLPGEPNDASGEDCAEMRSIAESAPGGLNDLGCNEDRVFMCESFAPTN